MKILIAASEAMPYVKTGGLADVTGALLKEFRKSGVDAFLFLPLYRAIRGRFNLADTGRKVHVPVGGRWLEGRVFSDGSGAYFLECNDLFDRDELYGTALGDYPDNAARFAFFCKGIVEACKLLGQRPDVIHCNDWQTGLIPLYLNTLYRDTFFGGTATIVTLHNLGYQGIFPASSLSLTGLGSEWFNPEGIEFYGQINYLKAGLIAADAITTVSPTYAREILTSDFGYGLDGVLRKRSQDLEGVLNGIDTDAWNPSGDAHIPAGYNATNLEGKALCRRKLLKECSLSSEDWDTPIAAFIGRLSEQKGIDILAASVDALVSSGIQLIILGKGDEWFHSVVASLSDRYRGRVFARIGYDESFARRIYAGSDIFFMPSRYEPCGLGQLIAMRYGTVPVARKTGGLADTIEDYNPSTGTGTGFLFQDYSAPALTECAERALQVYREKRQWMRIMRYAMRKDFSWTGSARKYLELYGAVAGRKQLRRPPITEPAVHH